MTPYPVTCQHIPQELLDLFKEMRDRLERLPDFDDEVMTCHALCEALRVRTPGFSRVDGTFGGIFPHSWLVHDRHPKVILDMYPVAGASPFIVYVGVSLLPWFRLYEAKQTEYDQEVFGRQVQKVLGVM